MDATADHSDRVDIDGNDFPFGMEPANGPPRFGVSIRVAELGHDGRPVADVVVRV